MRPFRFIAASCFLTVFLFGICGHAAFVDDNHLQRDCRLTLKLLEEGKLDEAKSKIAPMIKNIDEISSEHIQVIECLDRLVMSLHEAGRNVEAENFARIAVQAHEKAQGSTNIGLVEPMIMLAHIVFSINHDVDEMDRLAKRATVILDKAENADSSYYADLYYLKARICHYGHCDEVAAEAFASKALAIMDRGSESIDRKAAPVLDLLMIINMIKENGDVANKYAKRAFAIRERVFPPRHRAVGISLSNLAKTFGMIQNYEAAEPLARRALSIHEEANASERIDDCLFLLAKVHFFKKEYEEAEKFSLRRVKLRENLFGRKSQLTVDALLDHAELLEDVKKAKETP